MPLLTFPLALLGLTSIPALAAVYWLRNRYRQQVVSSLMLWGDHREAREGGRRVQRLQLPLLFLLEALILLLLVLAATDPQVRWTSDARPLVVVLDDSYSMLAGGTNSARSQAEKALRDELNHSRGSVSLIAAGPQPQVLGAALERRPEVDDALKLWRCHWPEASLTAAINLAAHLGGPRARVLVLTDTAAPRDFLNEDGRVRWIATGKSRRNLALVTAARTRHESIDRCLLEVSNLSDAATRADLALRPVGASTTSSPLRTWSLELPARGTQRIVFELPTTTGALQATLPEDDLLIDNTAFLPPPIHKRVRVKLDIGNWKIGSPIEQALEATGRCEIVESNPDLLITDRAATPSPASRAWTLRLHTGGEDAQAYVGPFVLDRRHPMTTGLSLDGVIWGARETVTLPGQALITAGNIPLLTQIGRPESALQLHLQLQRDLSTLLQSPDWPALWWNLIHWRSSELPGPARSLLRVGQMASYLQSPSSTAAPQRVAPDGTTRTLTLTDQRASWMIDTPGIYRVISSPDSTTSSAQEIYANVGDAAESDLTSRSTVAQGQWTTDARGLSAYRSAAWVLLLLAIGSVVLHGVAVARSVTGGVRT